MAKQILFYLQLHQPIRVSKLSLFDFKPNIDIEDLFQICFDTELNKQILNKTYNNCYRPVLTEINDLAIKVNLGVTGTLIDQFDQPQLKELKGFLNSDLITVLGETYYHSLSSLYDFDEFKKQVDFHQNSVQTKLGKNTIGFRNTELLTHQEVLDFTNNTYLLVEENEFFKHEKRLLKRNNSLSDFIGFHLKDNSPKELVQLILKSKNEYEVIGIDFETFGEHYNLQDSINFIKELVSEYQKEGGEFIQISDLPELRKSTNSIKYSEIISWADVDKNETAWLGNEMQRKSIKRIYNLKDKVVKTNDSKVFDVWRMLQTSDHFYYMSTKKHEDGEVHEYFSPFNTPQDAYVYYNNVLTQFELFLNNN